MKKVLGVIPARYGSTRFEGKPLHIIAGKPMIQWVYERCGNTEYLSDIIVATDDQRIFDTVIAFGGNAMMTSSDHPSGTDRIAEVAQNYPEYEIIVNIQGDEPMIAPQMIDRTVEPLLLNDEIPVCTPVRRIESQDDILNPNIVKVVRDYGGFALYFSRAPIPFDRDGKGLGTWYKHIGLYVYQRSFLLEYTKMKTSSLENTEKLEQLRILENGYKILTVPVPFDSVGVDTPEDALKAEKLIIESLNRKK